MAGNQKRIFSGRNGSKPRKNRYWGYNVLVFVFSETYFSGTEPKISTQSRSGSPTLHHGDVCAWLASSGCVLTTRSGSRDCRPNEKCKITLVSNGFGLKTGNKPKQSNTKRHQEEEQEEAGSLKLYMRSTQIYAASRSLSSYCIKMKMSALLAQSDLSYWKYDFSLCF